VALALLSCAGGPRLTHVLLISIDSLRADHLGAYGYARPTSPRIDRLAREGTLFERALSSTSWTCRRTPPHHRTSRFATVS
jgi:glucan phosphoethanolaminetransferase (alkaline phosphatase superfamily)